jgi:hypothetical protein
VRAARASARLFVVPVVYTLLDDLALRVLGKKPVKAAEPTHAYGD